MSRIGLFVKQTDLFFMVVKGKVKKCLIGNKFAILIQLVFRDRVTP